MITVLLFMLLVAAPVLAGSSGTPLTWYTNGQSRLMLNPVAADGAAVLLLSGVTSQKTLIVRVAKKGGGMRSNPIPVARDGSFTVRYLLKEGVGNYTVSLFGNEQSGALNFSGLCHFDHEVQKGLPAELAHLELNDKIVAFVDRVVGSRVGRGECWDLAQEALDSNLADWNRPTQFGTPLDPERTPIKGGDIIQFTSVTITERFPDGGTRWETVGAPDHTAIILKVLGGKRYLLAQQNVEGKRYVVTSEMNLALVTAGTYRIYRPVALMIPH